MAVAVYKWNAKKITFRLFAYSYTKAGNDAHTHACAAAAFVRIYLAACVFACGTVCECQRCIN